MARRGTCKYPSPRAPRSPRWILLSAEQPRTRVVGGDRGLLEATTLYSGSSIVSISALRLFPCGSMASERVTPPPSTFSITKFSARNFGNS